MLKNLHCIEFNIESIVFIETLHELKQAKQLSNADFFTFTSYLNVDFIDVNGPLALNLTSHEVAPFTKAIEEQDRDRAMEALELLKDVVVTNMTDMFQRFTSSSTEYKVWQEKEEVAESAKVKLGWQESFTI